MSILTSIKKMLGIEEDYEDFDMDITIHINSVLSILTQLGVGPKTGFHITDKTQTWEEFIGDNPLLNDVKTYVYLKVKMIFDPMIGSGGSSLESVIEELEWRINSTADIEEQ